MNTRARLGLSQFGFEGMRAQDVLLLQNFSPRVFLPWANSTDLFLDRG